MARSNPELERTQKGSQDRRSLHQCEVLSDADARSRAEWQIAVAIPRLRRCRFKAARIKSIGLAPQRLVTVNSIDRHVNGRSGTDMLGAQRDVAPGLADNQCRGRIEAHGFLYDLIRITERIDMGRTNRTASSRGGNLALDPPLDLRMKAQKIKSPS